MIYLLLALGLIAIATLIYQVYQKDHNMQKLLISLSLLCLLLIFTYATKIMLVYKPLLILHIALVIMGWRGLIRFLIKGEKHFYWIFSPAVSLLLFVIISLFFRENG